MQHYKSTLGISLAVATISLAIAVFISYYLMRYGINLSDEPYYILYAEQYETGAMFSLSSVCYGLWGKIFGGTWMSYRALATTLFDLSIIASSAYYYHVTRKATRAVGVCALLILLLSLSRGVWIGLIGADSLTMLTGVIFTICILEYLSKPKVTMAAIIAVVGATMTWLRFPNVVCVVIAIAAIIYANCSQQRGIKRLTLSLATYLGVLIAAQWLLLILLYGGWSQYSYYMNLNAGNNVQASFAYLVTTPLYHLFVWIIPAMALMLSFAFMANLSLGARASKARLLALALVTLFAVGETALLWRLTFLNKHTLYIATFWFFIGYAWLQTYRQKTSPMPIIAILLCCFIAAAGSNTGLMKCSTYSLFPLLLIYIKPDRLFNAMAVLTVCCILAVNVLSLRSTTFCDAGLPQLTSEVAHPKLKGLRTTDAKARQLEEVINDFTRCCSGERQPMVLGNTSDRYAYEYLFTGKNLTVGNPFSGHDYYNDPHFVDAVDIEISQSAKPMAVLFLKDGDKGAPSLMQQMVASHFDNALEKPTYIIYY